MPFVLMRTSIIWLGSMRMASNTNILVPTDTDSSRTEFLLRLRKQITEVMDHQGRDEGND